MESSSVWKNGYRPVPDRRRTLEAAAEERGQAGNTEILIRVERALVTVREFQYFLPDPFSVVDVTD